MAKVLDDHQFKRPHDFKQYELNTMYRAEKGVDFEGSVDSFRNRLYAFARSEGYEAKTETDGDAVIFRLTKSTK
jgi:hypothetical protein